jgi:hypothetical protein
MKDFTRGHDKHRLANDMAAKKKACCGTGRLLQ